MDRIRRKLKEVPVSHRNAALDQVIQDCMKDGILSDFLRENRAEVIKMSIYEYDEELHLMTVREEGREEGRAEARANTERERKRAEEAEEKLAEALKQVAAAEAALASLQASS